ncbi:MAG TPA: hypothetical protein VGE57_02540 [Solimonas sp.]
MPRKPKKQPAQTDAPKSYDEFVDDAEGGDDDVGDTERDANVAAGKLRDWRDVEKLKEERALRRLIGDDLDFDLDSPRANRGR